MAKIIPDSVLDSMANLLKGTVIRVLSSEPADRAAAVAATLATQAFSGTITNGAGSPDGRSLTFPEQTDVPITVTGTATHVSLDDGAILNFATTCTSQALTSGGTVTVPQFTYTLRDVA